jgi:hypothetical protein
MKGLTPDERRAMELAVHPPIPLRDATPDEQDAYRTLLEFGRITVGSCRCGRHKVPVPTADGIEALRIAREVDALEGR